MCYPPYFKVGDAKSFFEAVAQAIHTLPSWKVDRVADRCGEYYLCATYTGGRLKMKDLGIVVCCYSHDPSRAYMTMHSTYWNRTSGGATFEEDYTHAEQLALPIFSAAGKILGRRLRLLRPKEKRNPLRGVLKREFERFVLSANKRCLHPLDVLRFYDFVRCTNTHLSVLTPDDVRYHLVQAGLDEETTERLAAEYKVGRRILARE